MFSCFQEQLRTMWSTSVQFCKAGLTLKPKLLRTSVH